MTNEEIQRCYAIEAKNAKLGVLHVSKEDLRFLLGLVERQHDEAHRVYKLLDPSGECREKTLEGVAKWRMEYLSQATKVAGTWCSTATELTERVKRAEAKLLQLDEAWCPECETYHSNLPPVIDALHRVRDHILAEENQAKESTHAE